MTLEKDLNKLITHDKFILNKQSWRCHMAIPSQAFKVCSICGKEKPLTGFHKHKGCHLGHMPMCKTCRSEHRKAIPKFQDREGFKTCTQCKKEKPISEYYQRKDGSLIAECKVCTRLRIEKRVYGPMKEIIRVKDNKSACVRRERIKEAVFAAYGGYKCACCGETEPLFLTIDHIDNNGAEHRRKITGKRHSAGYHTYKWLLKNNFPDGFQVLCMNCNYGKRMNNGVCPHKGRFNDYSKEVGPSGSKRAAPKLEIMSG